jgi:hypothetical protein
VLPGEQTVVSGNYQLQFVQDRSAIPAGGGHGHDHGPGGEHLTEEDALAHGEKPPAGEHSHGGDSHGHGHERGHGSSLWARLFGSPLTLVLAVGLLLSIGLNILLLSLKKPANHLS